MYSGLLEYLNICPYLEGKKFHFDSISENPVSYSLSIPPNTPDIFIDALGNIRSQQVFYLMSVTDYGLDDENNIDNLEFFQSVKEWFENQNEKEIFPDLGEGKGVRGVYATTDGYIENTETNYAQYQIQCLVEYVQINKKASKMPDRF